VRVLGHLVGVRFAGGIWATAGWEAWEVFEGMSAKGSARACDEGRIVRLFF
jgi:hypothetical protein